jgi:hypothetical protein
LKNTQSLQSVNFDFCKLDLDLMGCRTKVDWTSQNWVRAAGRSWFQAQWAFLPFQTGGAEFETGDFYQRVKVFGMAL